MSVKRSPSLALRVTVLSALDQIQFAMSALWWSVALRAGAVDLQPMTSFDEAVLIANLLDDCGDRFVGELDQFAALRTDQVVVLRVTVVVLVDLTTIRPRDFAEQTRLFQQLESAVHGRSADTSAGFVARDFCDQIIRIEVFVLSEYLIDDDRPLASQPFPFCQQELTKFFDGGQFAHKTPRQ